MNKFLKKFQKDTALLYTIAFGVPVFILILIYIFRSIYPFGDSCYLRSDMYHQYVTFLAALQDKIKNGETLLYSWDIGGGVNFIALFAYYLASPTNWLTILIPQEHVIEFMSVFMIIKSGLCGVTFTYYISKRHNTNDLAVAVISIFYALSGYICAYNWNVMWLDCIVLFPLIVLGLERIIKGGKPTLYCVTLALSILSNYYISIMTCIFCVLYFFMYMISACDFKSVKKVLAATAKFGIFSLLAGGMAACLLLPEISALMLTVSGEFSFPKALSNYFSIFEMVSRQLMTVEPAIFSAHEPNIYSGLIVFLLVPLYALNPNTSTKEKIGRFFFLFIFYLSFNLNIPDYIWHGFHFPNSLPCRQSFIFTFLLLAMSYEGFAYVKKCSHKEIWAIFGGVTVLFLIIEQTFSGSSYSFSIVYLSLLFVAIYAVVLALYRRNSWTNTLCATIFLLTAFFEAFINTEATSIFTTGRSHYLNDNAAITNVINEVAKEDDSFYRIEKLTRRTKNDSAWHHYHGLSLFSSTTNAGFAELLAALGGEDSTNSYGYYGATPLVEALTNVKYVLGKEGLESPYRTLAAWDEETYLYENIYNFGMGYMVPDTLEEDWNIDINNPFSIQNSFAALTTRCSPLFTSVSYRTSGNTAEFSPDAPGQVYAYITSTGKSFNVEYTDLLYQPIGDTLNVTMNQKYMLDLGYLDETYNVSITATDNSTINLYLYTLNEEVFKDFCEEFGKSTLKVTSYDETHLNGTINVSEAGTFVSSIIWDEGWTVTVDGKEVETKPFKEALISFPLDAGTHEICFSYYPVGLKEGLTISAVSLVIFLAATIVPLLLKKKKKSVPADDNNNFDETDEVSDDADTIAEDSPAEVVSEDDIPTKSAEQEDILTERVPDEDIQTRYGTEENIPTKDTTEDNILTEHIPVEDSSRDNL